MMYVEFVGWGGSEKTVICFIMRPIRALDYPYVGGIDQKWPKCVGPCSPPLGVAWLAVHVEHLTMGIVATFSQYLIRNPSRLVLF